MNLVVRVGAGWLPAQGRGVPARHPGVPGLGQMGLKAARGGTHHLIQ